MEYTYDTKTTNISFLKMSKYLKDNGISNHFFMLRLIHPSLSGVDPFSDSLTSSQMYDIFDEIRENPWYFFREIARIPAAGGAEPDRFELNLGDMAMVYCDVHNVDHIAVLPRQTGKTTTEVLFSIWCNCFGTTNSTETYLHKSQKGADANLKRFKDMKSTLPKWLSGLVCDPGRDKDNSEEKYVSRLNNDIVSKPSASSPDRADKIGRGTTTPLVYEDELAFQTYNKIIWNALIPAWNTAADTARKNNAPYCVRVTTTPNSLALPEASFCFGLIQDALRFTLSMYDVPEDSLQEYVRCNSNNGFLFIEYTWKELGKDQEWYDKIKSKTDYLNVQREVDLIWPESSEGMFFSAEQLDPVKKYLKPVAFNLLVLNKFNITFYESPEFTKNYIISCDVATHADLDRSALTIIDPEDFHVVANYSTSHIDTDTYRKIIYTLATFYFPHAIVVIENNSIGTPILDILMKDPAIEPRLYREEDRRMAEVTLEDGKIVKTTRKKMIYGVTTASNGQHNGSRDKMFAILRDIVDTTPEAIVSPELYSELRTLQVKKNGRVEALSSAHDDLIMSYLISRYAILYGECFKQKFHISPIPSIKNVRNTNYMSDMLTNFGSIMAASNANAAAKNPNSDYSQFAQMSGVLQDMRNKDIKQGYGYSPSNNFTDDDKKAAGPNNAKTDNDINQNQVKPDDTQRRIDWIASLNK
jgi:hypothetical protein